MGPATIRRLASVAAIVLVALVWCRPAGLAGLVEGLEASDRPSVVQGLGGAGRAPAVVRQSHAGWWVHGTRPDHGKGPLAAAVVAVMLLAGPVFWGRHDGSRSAPSPLARRRHVIALRAPPLPLPV